LVESEEVVLLHVRLCSQMSTEDRLWEIIETLGELSSPSNAQ